MRDLDDAAKRVFMILGEARIPAKIIGGYAMSIYGYRRYTEDIDIVVRDHKRTLDLLLAQGYIQGKCWFRVIDPEGKVGIDVLPSGLRMSGNDIPNPVVSEVSTLPEFVALNELIKTKLGVVVNNESRYEAKRKNESDVMELIKSNALPRGWLGNTSPLLSGNEEIANDLVKIEYNHLWDILHSETEISKKGEWVDPFEEFLK